MARSSKQKKSVFYWDTNIFIRYIAGRTKGAELFDAISEVAKLVKDGQAVLVTSSYTRTELSQTQMRPRDFEIFDSVMSRRNVVSQAYDDAIAELGSELQAELRWVGKQLSPGDLIHLATAVNADADVFHTTDRALKSCGDEPCLRGMKIIEPTLTQFRLF